MHNQFAQSAQSTRRLWSVQAARNLLAGVALLALIAALVAPVSAAGDFAAPVFRYQWDAVEATTSNFWGPLVNATNGINEPYAEAPGGQRLVQYFDKARMELAGPNSVTNGLLTVELKTGRVQTGNDTFEQRLPATIGIAGDPGQYGPTYADLAKLPERVPAGPGTALTTVYSNGEFVQSSVIPTDAALALTQYVTDPGGRFGQYVPQAFTDYLNRLPLPYLAAMGYPISPAFGTQLLIGGVPRTVFIQAFERRVLTYTPGNPVGFAVEFGNIGQHYYQWRYAMPTAPLAPPFPTAPPVPPMAPPATPTPVSVIILPQPALHPVAPLPTALPSLAPAGGFDPIFGNAVGTFIGRGSSALPLGNAVGVAYGESISFQPFENGYLLYLPSTNRVYVLSRTGMLLTSYVNTFVEDGKNPVALGPRPGTYLPVRGFGKVYNENPRVQPALGLGIAPERGYRGTVQIFERGLLVDDPTDGFILALNNIASTWDSAPR